MHLLVFDTFAKTIEALPAAAILKALDLESKLLKYEWENYRLYLPEEAYSIFCFRQFVRHAKLGQPPGRCKPLPAAHVRFYKQIITRLIEGNELPPSAMEQFNSAFSIAHQCLRHNAGWPLIVLSLTASLTQCPSRLLPRLTRMIQKPFAQH